MGVPDFNIDFMRGESGEQLVRHALTSCGFHVSKSKVLDYDLDVLEGQGPSISKVEVKYDEVSARTGNIFFELLSNELALNLGAGLKTFSDLIVFLTPNGETVEMRFMPTQKLIAYAILGLIEKRYIPKRVGGNKSCMGLAIPLRNIEHLVSLSLVTDKSGKVLSRKGEL